MTWLGLDIGGANLKIADARGWARSVPFPLWREPKRLSSALIDLVDAAPKDGPVAVTMTGELCDCFRTKTEGVFHILAAVEQAAAEREVRVYLVDGRLVSVDEARQSPHLAAASNWHVLARFACRFAHGDSALLMDIGSTTTDIVPLIDGRPRPRGFNDTDRMLNGELVYSGVGRTPICSLTSWIPWRDQRCPVAAELFATAADVYVLLGDLPERPDSTATADGRPFTREFAHERMARMICADASQFNFEDARRAAQRVKGAQIDRLANAARQVLQAMQRPPQAIVVSGAGEFLAAVVCRTLWPHTRVNSLSEQINPGASECGPAYALSILASETA
jgi:probable H4MPT-linked C1 transfer pathway protein